MRLTREEYDKFMYDCMWYNRVNLNISALELQCAHKVTFVYSDNQKWVIEWFMQLKELFGGNVTYNKWEVRYDDETNDTHYHWYNIKNDVKGYRSHCIVIDARSDFSYNDLVMMQSFIASWCGGIEILFPEAIEIID